MAEATLPWNGERRRYAEEQINRILKEHPALLSAQDLCRKHGISDATF